MITVIGLGVVGLTTALGLSEKGNKVYGYDVNLEKIKTIKNKKLPFFEKDLQKVLKKNLNNTFFLVSSLKEALQKSKIIFLCVETPVDNNGETDLKYVKTAIDSVVSNLNKKDKKIVIIRSTIPPSTTSKKLIPYIENKGLKVGKDIFIANNPEFLREGNAWNDFVHPDRIVVGTSDDYVKKELKKIYLKFGAPICFVTLNTGEFIKYLSNTFLSTLISYSNEMSVVAEYIGDIDTKSAFKIFHEDKRWCGQPANMINYVYPGCGFGGSCLPKDTKALIKKAKENGYKTKILQDVISINNEIKKYWINKIKEKVPKNKSIVILGLSFKPESDDVRQSPAFEIIKLLLKEGYKKIISYDPVSNELFDKVYKVPVKYEKDLKTAVDSSDVVIIVTAWKEFLENKRIYKGKQIFDLRYCL